MNRLDEALKQERFNEDLLQNKGTGEKNCDATVDTVDTMDTTVEGDFTEEPLLHALKVGTGQDSRALNKTARYRSPRRRAAYSPHSRSYDMKQIGKQKDLPCPSAQESQSGYLTMSSNLFAHSRITGGTKILSFSDSTWIGENVEAGFLRTGGNFKTAICRVDLEGLGLYIMDDFPRELMAVVVRDLQFHKPAGSIKATARVRHFQVSRSSRCFALLLPSSASLLIINNIIMAEPSG